MSSSPTIWTIGHSNHELRNFVELLGAEQIAFLVDVRSFPYSRFAPHFNREQLEAAMLKRGVQYLFLGVALGGRPEHEEHYDCEGRALYAAMAEQPEFGAVIEGLLHGAHDHRLALLCSCGDPSDCHRRLLVGKVLCERGAQLCHILPDGRVQTELRVMLNDPSEQPSLFELEERPWRSARSVSHRRRLNTSSGV